MSKITKKYYRDYASSFGWGERSAVLDKERVSLIDKFTVGKRVLDIGCGAGLYVDYLAKKGLQAYGVDFVDEFITQAKKLKKGTFVKGQAEKLPFKDDAFDTCLLFNILEHAVEDKTLKEAKRIAKKRILVIVPKVVDEILEKSGVIFHHYLDKSHLREYEADDLKRLAKLYKLKLIHLQPAHPLYNETIFLSLFEGSVFFKKLIRKLVFFILPKKIYLTEYFAVFEKR